MSSSVAGVGLPVILSVILFLFFSFEKNTSYYIPEYEFIVSIVIWYEVLYAINLVSMQTLVNKRYAYRCCY
jgi:hypothetical protein